MDRSSSIKILVIILVVIINIIALTCAFSSIYTTAKRVINAEDTSDEIIDFEPADDLEDNTDETSGELKLTEVLGKYFKESGISTILYAIEVLVGINLIIVAIVLTVKIRKL